MNRLGKKKRQAKSLPQKTFPTAGHFGMSRFILGWTNHFIRAIPVLSTVFAMSLAASSRALSSIL